MMDDEISISLSHLNSPAPTNRGGVHVICLANHASVRPDSHGAYSTTGLFLNFTIEFIHGRVQSMFHKLKYRLCTGVKNFRDSLHLLAREIL